MSNGFCLCGAHEFTPNAGICNECQDYEDGRLLDGQQPYETREEVRDRLVAQLAPKGQSQPRNIMDQLLGIWTIPEYVDWLNGHSDPRAHGGLMREESDWAPYGITTALGVAQELDACVEKERRKDGF